MSDVVLSAKQIKLLKKQEAARIKKLKKEANELFKLRVAEQRRKEKETKFIVAQARWLDKIKKAEKDEMDKAYKSAFKRSRETQRDRLRMQLTKNPLLETYDALRNLIHKPPQKPLTTEESTKAATKAAIQTKLQFDIEEREKKQKKHQPDSNRVQKFEF